MVALILMDLKGNSYRLLFGDFNQIRTLSREAKSKPINFTNNIIPRVIPFIHVAVRKYGENCYLWFGPRAAVIVTNPEVIREILQKSYVFQKPSGNPLGRLLAKGIASYETDKWAKHRKLINPAFQTEKIKRMVPSFYLSCAEMLGKWEKIVPSQESCEVDVWPYLKTMTSDVISRTAFGSSYEEGRRIFELQQELAVLVMESMRSVYVPGLRFLPTKKNRRMKQLAKEMKTSILEIVTRRMKALKAGEKCSDDLLDLLLESNFKEMEEHGSKFGMSLEEVIEECKLFYFAGQETTANLLVWTMILLSKHQDWQARAREEVLHVFGQAKPDYQEINQLKIINMILHEVLRLYPPGVMLSRVTLSESKFGNLSIPAGVQLMLPVILLHHDRRIWGEDALEFNPERFGEGVSKATQGQLAYLPFGWGPRICPGQNFSLLEAKLALAMILQRFSFRLSHSYAHAPQTVITLQPQHGAQLILERLLQ
ncbi:Cytochrome P450 72A15 [Striga hermonthica]|uniref:Cytochrome P450 72A15 n=1 Tax=Striga hermonthica TaxID=68872 RepID=A0A9N7MK44_STRHE|nr:Cytochrome P450 72A15 [Striga hermonthica]